MTMTEASTSWLPAANARENGHYMVWTAAGLLHAGEAEKARGLIEEALVAGADRRAAARLLLGGAYVRLGRAALLTGQGERALRGLQESLRLGTPGGTALFLDLLIAEAERCSRCGETREAVQRWQDIATLLGAETPAWVYERLSAAYANNHQGFGGTPEENHCWGDAHKHDLLSRFHERLAPRLYLEIGVDEGLSLARARGPAIGVDPRPRLDLKVTPGAQAVSLQRSHL